ncbi:MAG: hypothetical protein LH645_04030 [Actinomycetia bacterium]|nr:hypothetical protein [Actinomycetes bacterium]
MGRAAPGPSGAAVGSGSKSHKVHTGKPRTVNLKYLDGIGGEVEQELRATEDEGVAVREQQAKLDGLYA